MAKRAAAKKTAAKKTAAKKAAAEPAAPEPVIAEFGKIPPWWFFVLLGVILGVGYLGFRGSSLHAWLLMFSLFALFIVMAGYNIKGVWRGAFIDRRNRVSLSNLQMICWTLLATSGYLVAVCFNMSFYDGRGDFFSVGIPQELWWLMGISTTTLIGSPLLLENKRKLNVGDPSASKVNEKSNPGQAEWSDMWKGEDDQNAAYLEISRVQMFFFTFIVFAGYAFQLGVMFWQAQGEGHSEAIAELPPISTGMLTLLGISHAGYLGKKSMTEQKGKSPNPGPT